MSLGQFYLVKGFTKAVERATSLHEDQRIELYIACLPVLATFAQTQVGGGVLSSDRLYGADSEYSAQLHTSFSVVIDRVLTLLGDFSQEEAKKYELVLLLLNNLIAVCQVGLN